LIEVVVGCGYDIAIASKRLAKVTKDVVMSGIWLLG